MLETTRIRDIYMHLQDETSKELFQKRLMYSLTGDEGFIKQIIDSLLQKHEVEILMEKAEKVKERLVVYGAGHDFTILKELYPGFSCICLCDKDSRKQETGWDGCRVISPEQLLEDYSGYDVLICTSRFQKDAYDFLIKNGWDQEKILNVGAAAISQEPFDQQYFEDGIMKPCEDEVFIDGGCYDCSTDRVFMEWCGGNYKKIYAFEPDVKNYEECLKKARDIPDIQLINKGLWSKEDVLHFAGNADQGSKITEGKGQGVTTVSVAAIDEVVVDDQVTFIKLDVEGAELEALKGAKRTITEQHPRLAISIYHKPEDIWEIPAYILSLSKDYRFYIRHYQLTKKETILYAV